MSGSEGESDGEEWVGFNKNKCTVDISTPMENGKTTSKKATHCTTWHLLACLGLLVSGGLGVGYLCVVSQQMEEGFRGLQNEFQKATAAMKVAIDQGHEETGDSMKSSHEQVSKALTNIGHSVNATHNQLEEWRHLKCEKSTPQLHGFNPTSKLWYLHNNQGGHRGKVYKVFKIRELPQYAQSHFGSAKKLCAKHKMRLLTVETAKEKDFIFKTLDNITDKSKFKFQNQNQVRFWTAGFADESGDSRSKHYYQWTPGDNTTTPIDRDAIGLKLHDKIGLQCLTIIVWSSSNTEGYGGEVEWRNSACCCHVFKIPICEAYLPSHCYSIF